MSDQTPAERMIDTRNYSWSWGRGVEGDAGSGSTEPPESDWYIEDSDSKFVYIGNLDNNIDAATVFNLFAYLDGGEPIDIFMDRYCAYAEFRNPKEAQVAAAITNGKHFGQVGMKVNVCVAPANGIPKGSQDHYGPSLRTFRERENEAEKLKSCTVHVTNLGNHERKKIMFMVERDPREEAWCTDLKVIRPGEALVKFNGTDWAAEFVRDWNGQYVKTCTVYAKCVPDYLIDDIIKQKNSEQPKGVVFVRNVPIGATKQLLGNVFVDYKIHDIKLISKPGSRGSAIVFLSCADANAILDKYEKSGIEYERHKYFVSEFKRGKKNKLTDGSRPARASPAS